MLVADFDFALPPELIAQEPVEPRDASRLLVLHRHSGEVAHCRFGDIVRYLRPGDVLVLNNTRVLPARLFATRAGTGGAVEVLLLRRLDLAHWEVLVRPGRKAQTGDRLVFGDGELRAVVTDHTDAGGRILEFEYQGVFEEILDRLGQMPLPPYIKKELVDKERYQTVYAVHPGSAAAPTAGLHFTPDLLAAISRQGVAIASVVLHVGLGTFRPVRTELVAAHHMHAEAYRVDAEAAETINLARERGGRVVAVGTTSVRVLETVSDEQGRVAAGSGWTDIFIFPGCRFRAVDAMVTNFHLPRSTLLMLTCAFAGREQTLAAYRQAVAETYRFFSFGDAMLIL